MKKLLLIVLMSCLFIQLYGDKIVYEGSKQYELLPLLSLEFSTVKQMCSPLLSPKGILVYEKTRNSVLIYDYPSVIKAVRGFLSKIDAPRTMLRVELTKLTTGQHKKNINNIRFDDGSPNSNGKIRIVNGKFPKNISVNLGRQRDNTSSVESSFIVTLSGNEANIFSGRELANPMFFDYMKLYPAKTIIMSNGTVLETPSYWPEIEIIKIGIIFVMKPTLLSNGMIHIELYPQFKELDKSGSLSHIKITSLSTSVTVAQGQKVNIGGAINSKRNEYSNLFGPDFFGGENNSSVMDMTIKATIVNSSNARLRHSNIPRCK